MTTSETTKAADTSLMRDMSRAAWHYLGNRRALLIIAVVAIAGGAALNWSWLVAAGIAPVLLTTLPCLVMCGLGLCVSKMVGGSCASQPSQPDKAGLNLLSGTDQGAAITSSPLSHISSCCGVSGSTNAATDEAKIPGAKTGEHPNA